MLQIICSCNRIAEVKHRKNGKKLAYTHCSSCGGGVVSTVKAAEIESQAKNDIGVKGDFLNPASKDVQSKQVDELKDFKPEAQLSPEFLEPDIKNEGSENDAPPVNSSGLLKVVFGFLFAAVIGGGVYQVSKGKG